MKNKNKKGFTLLEILLVVAAIGILAGIVIVAINPNKQLGDTRNAQRQSNVSTILNAVYQYSVDNNGVLPASITTSSKTICSTTGAACVTGGFADLGVLIDLQKYITAIPTDPKCAVADSTCYTIIKTANNRVTVSAPDAESGAIISVTK